MPNPNDQTLLTWVRLVDGRLWHIATDVPIGTRCGREAVPDGATLLPERATTPPTNGWVCDRCVRRLHEMASGARQAWLTDPRRCPGDHLPAPDPGSPPEPEFELCTSTIRPEGDEVRCGLPSGHVEFHTDKGLRYHWADNPEGGNRAITIPADVTPADPTTTTEETER